MIKSCKDCKTPCCRMGSGPYKLVTPDEYLENYETTDGYNTQCMAFDDKTQRCRLWGTSEFPVGCRCYVCTVREFSKKELEDIDHVMDDRECPKCNAPYLLHYSDVLKEWWEDKCEFCGFKRRFELAQEEEWGEEVGPRR